MQISIILTIVSFDVRYVIVSRGDLQNFQMVHDIIIRGFYTRRWANALYTDHELFKIELKEAIRSKRS